MRADFEKPLGGTPLLRNILANIPLYRGLDTQYLDQLVNASLPMRLDGAALLIKRGAPATGIYAVVHGQMRLYFTRSDGTEKTLAILGHGKSFGLPETVLNLPHLAFARALSDGMVIYTPREKILEVARQDAGFMMTLMAAVAHQSYRLMEDVKRQTVHSATQRLAGFLLRQSKYQSSKDIELNFSKTLVASKLGISNETFSRLLHGFSNQGLIEVRGRQITILDPKKMGAIQAA